MMECGDIGIKDVDDLEEALERYGPVAKQLYDGYGDRIGGLIAVLLDDLYKKNRVFMRSGKVYQFTEPRFLTRDVTIENVDVTFERLSPVLVIEDGCSYKEEDLFPHGVPQTLLLYARTLTSDDRYIVKCPGCGATYEKFVWEIPRDYTLWITDFYNDHVACLVGLANHVTREEP